MAVLAFIFWFALAGLAYVYAGYPLLVLLASIVRRRPVRKADYRPRISILIAAYNEEQHVGRTIANKLQLDYPQHRLEIIVVSDGSTDATDAIVRGFAASGVRLLRQEPRNGKTAALNLAAAHATGDLLVFADANSIYHRSALAHLADNFGDPTVGYVTGHLIYAGPDGNPTVSGCAGFMEYEHVLRVWETAAGSIVGVNGGIDAVRRGLYEPMSPDDLPDLRLPLTVVAHGYRVVYEPAALLAETANDNARDEYRMRVRVALRAFWTLAEMGALFNVRQYGFYAIELLSHKALRYLAFVLLATTLVASALLAGSATVYLAAFLVQAGFLACALAGSAVRHAGPLAAVLSMPYYFVLVNAAAMQAFFKFLRRERSRMWQPRQG